MRSEPRCSPHCRHLRRVGHKQLADPSACIGRLLMPELLLAANVPGDSCTVPRRRGSITHQPEDAPYGGFGPDLPCSPLSDGSSRFEVDDPGTQGIPRLPQVPVPFCFQGEALRDLCSPTTFAACTRCLSQTMFATRALKVLK